MDTLPLLVLETICEYLACVDARRRDFYAFALTSRACGAAADRERFSRLFLKVSDKKQLEDNLQRLEAALAIGGRRRFVRTIRVRGLLGTAAVGGRNDKSEKELHDVSDAGGDEEAVTTTVRFQNDKRDPYAGVEDPFAIKLDDEWPGYDKLADFTPENRTWLNEAWTPLATFMSGLNLKDLIWASPSQVPLCVLSLLHQAIPNCRLHVHSFDLRSMHRARGVTPVMDESEWTLATSPSLHTVGVTCSWYDYNYLADFNKEVLNLMVTGYAPNLQRVHTWWRDRHSGPWRSNSGSRKQAWEGFGEKAPSALRTTRGQLRSLDIQSGGQHSPELPAHAISEWASRTDIRYLQSLRFRTSLTLGALEKLAELAEGDEFVSLKDLQIPVSLTPSQRQSTMDKAVARILTALRPLERLVTTNISDRTINALAVTHGPSLQCLEIDRYVFTLDDLQQLSKCCRSLARLTIEIIRTSGDQEEMAKYRTLGSMPKLKKLKLNLQCTALCHTWPPPGSTSSPPTEALVVEMRKVLINSALDEKLASAIFNTICRSSTTAFPSLADLTLCPIGAHSLSFLHHYPMYQDFRNIVRWLGHEWSVQRDPRDTHCDEVTAKEVEENIECYTRGFQDGQLCTDLDKVDESACWPQIWRELWPETGRGWKHDWYSFPLASDARKS
jgi:hypothetical protein